MKQQIRFAAMLLAAALVAAACQKETPAPTGEGPETAKTVTISVSMPDELTKVALSQKAAGGMELTWEASDVITVQQHGNSSTAQTFTLTSGAGDKKAEFTGTAVTGSSFDIIYTKAGSLTQAADGSTDHIGYSATLSGVSSYESVKFAADWASANGGTLIQSGVLHVKAKLPAGVAATVNAVTVKASKAIFGSTDNISVAITTPGSADDILDVYAAIDGGSALAAGDWMTVQFGSTNDAHSVYTRYIPVDAAKTFAAGSENTLEINCVNTDKYAGLNDAGTATAPYLIADKYQLNSVAGLTEHGQTKYFKLIDNVDMAGITWSIINPQEGTDNSDNPNFDKAVNFDGNNKTISNLGSSMFYVFKGSVSNLTLDKANVTSRGVFAEYCQGSGNTVTNVNVTDGKVNSASSNVGGLIGQINNDTSAGVNVVTISNCTVSGTDITGAGVVGGLVGYANELVSISGCTYTGGKVTASARWCGGLIGSTGDFASVIAECHVTDAEIKSSSDRVGGCVGQIGKNGVTFKGCTVGTSAQKVAVSSTLSGANVNLGGFVGVCYGTVTKNGDVRSEAHVTITSGNTDASKYVNIGGFVGYLEKGTVEYSDAEATMSGIKGHQVGGFAAILTSGGVCKVDNCTANATVSGNNYVAGFIGQAAAANHVVSNNTSAGTVTGAATVAGFVGLAAQGTWTKNSTSCTVTASGANSGNFAGQLSGNVTVSRCFCTGSITGSGNVCGGFTGIANKGATINDCYSTCTIGGGTRKRGGIAGYVDAGTVSINRCYTTSNISNNFEMGGLVGFVNVETFTMTKCAAWNETLVASSRTSSNWSSAACVGVAYLTCTLTDNYRNPNMDSLVYWGTNSGCEVNLPNTFQHPNVSASAPLTDPDGNAVTSGTMRPYQGKCDTSKTLSQLASTTLGWSGDVWDFSGNLPTLK